MGKKYTFDEIIETEKRKKIFFVRIGEFFQYSIWMKITDFFQNLKWFFRNFKSFYKILWKFRSWDHSYCVNVYRRSLELLKDHIQKHGNEIEISRNKKINKLQELIDLLHKYDTYTDNADKGIGFFDMPLNFEQDENGNWCITDKSKDERSEKYKNLIKREKELELEYKDKVAKLLFGQSEREIIRLTKKLKKQLKEENKHLTEPTNDEKYNIFLNVFDGSGCRTWWN